MATITAHHETLPQTQSKFAFGEYARLALFSAMPLAAFGGANFVAEAMGAQPLFFSPGGLPGWLGAALHLALLFTIGLSLGLAYATGRRGRKIMPWGIALVIGMVAFPFFAGWLDAFALALVMTFVLLIGFATSLRIARVSRLGGWLMLPTLFWVGFGAVLGLAVAAAWSPPFALITAQNTAPASV